MTKGPAWNREELKFRNSDELDVGFRLLSDYDIHTDSVVTRFDLLLNSPRPVYNEPFVRVGDQTNKVICSSASNLVSARLPVPKGVMLGLTVEVNRQDLIEALRELVAALEGSAGGEAQ